MRVVDARDLPTDPLDAAEAFYVRVMPGVRHAIRSGDLPVTIAFAAADHAHAGWRLAAVQSLAREAAPGRVNAIAGGHEAAVAETLAYLAAAPGITGQLLAVDGKLAETR